MSDSQIQIPDLSTKLDREFFARHADEVAQDLLGRILVVNRLDACPLYARLHEVAAYEGKTRSMSKGALYAPGIFSVSTKHANLMLDISTLDICKPSCVTLVSANIYDLRGQGDFVQGAGNLAKTIGVTMDFDALPMGHPPLWIGGIPVDPSEIKQRHRSNLPPNCKGYFYFQTCVFG